MTFTVSSSGAGKTSGSANFGGNDGRERQDALFRSVDGVVTVGVEFDGGGDSGSIGQITFHGLLDDKAYHELSIPPDVQLGSRITTLGDYADWAAYEMVEEVGYDWANNDGGYGSMKIDVDAGTAVVDMNIRYVTSEHSQHSVGVTDIDITPEVTESVDG